MAEPERVLRALGVAIRHVRRERRLSQEQLGLATGVHRNYIGGIERAERSPSLATAATLADALELPLWELLRIGEQLLVADGE